MTQAQADRFAARWIAAWNRHDLDAILAHYAATIEFTSPFAARLTGDALVRGQDALRAYFALALERFPDLRFDDVRAFPGATGVTLVYRSVQNLEAAETMILDAHERAVQVWAHYRTPIG